MNKRTNLIFYVLVSYIVLQFLWWEILLVRQSNEIISMKQNLVALSSPDESKLEKEVNELQNKKIVRVYMIVGEGTVFLLILLFGIYQVHKSIKKENELSNQQKNFILSISHELKTPIASSKLQLQTLLKHELNRDMQVQMLTTALTETDRLHKLVDNVLLVTQIENASIQIHKQTLNLTELLQHTVDRYFEMYIQNNWITLSLEEDIMYDGDKDLLPSVFINLIENAIKYSGEDLTIHVSLQKSSSFILFQVYDNGIGISDLEKDKVYQKFYRVGNEETRKTKGTGIGLFIVKQICQAHNSSIKIKNNKPNGSIFEIEFV